MKQNVQMQKAIDQEISEKRLHRINMFLFWMTIFAIIGFVVTMNVLIGKLIEISKLM